MPEETFTMFPHHYEMVTREIADAWGRAKAVERGTRVHAYLWDHLRRALGGAFHAAMAFEVMTPRRANPGIPCQ